MKRITPVLLLLFFAPTLMAEDDEVRVRLFMDAWVKSFNDNDPEKISAFYEVDERVEMLVSRGLSFRGHKAISASYDLDMKALRFYDSEWGDARIRVFENTALVAFTHRFKYEIFEERSHRQIHIRTTTTLRRTEAGWLIVMEHSSAIDGVERETIIEEP